MTPREWAERYASLGLRVVPTPPGQKFPQGVGRWQDVATSDLTTGAAASWWLNGTADHSISIALGDLGQRCVFVVDVDEAGKAAWEALIAEHGLPVTWTARTGGDGWHLWFWTYLHVTNANSFPAGIDVRGEGGQVVAPPSVHATGQRYAWEEGLAPWDVKLAKAPDWIVRLVAAQVPEAEPAPVVSDQVTGDRPGDLWAAEHSWAQVLEPDGWTLAKTDRRTGEQHWTRPGKDKREGSSATTGFGSYDLLKVFTSSVPQLDAESTYTKLGYLAAMHHGGDLKAAAARLAEQGYAKPDLSDALLAHHSHVSGPTAPAEPSSAPSAAETPQSALEWPEPRPIPRGDPPPPWPSEVLPDWMQAQVDNVTNQLRCPADLPGMYALGALATIGLGNVQVEPRPDHLEHAAAWLGTIALPSEGKSPAMQMMLQPVYDLEEQEMSLKADEVAAADVKRNVAEKAAKRAEEAAGKDDDPLAALQRATELRQAAQGVETPPEGRLVVGDVTPEKLAQVLSRNAERIAIVSDEAGALSFDRYGDKARGSNLDIYLKAWSGQRAAVDRISAPSILLKRPLLTIVLGAQPGAWRRALEDEEFRTRGLGARFMACSPEPVAHLRATDFERDVWDKPTAKVYRDRMMALGQRWLHSGTFGIVVTPSSEARRAFGAWADAGRWRYQEGGPLEGDAAWYAKMYDTLWRLCALIHLAEGHSHHDPISADLAERITLLGDYWVAHRMLDIADRSGPARRLLRTLANLHDEEGKVHRQRLHEGGSRGMRDPEEVHELVEMLGHYGWVKISWPGMPMGRDKWWRIPGWVIHVHPAADQWKRAPGEHPKRSMPIAPVAPVAPRISPSVTDDYEACESGGKGGEGLYSVFGASSGPENDLQEEGLPPLPPLPLKVTSHEQAYPDDDDIGMDLFER